MSTSSVSTRPSANSTGTEKRSSRCGDRLWWGSSCQLGRWALWLLAPCDLVGSGDRIEHLAAQVIEDSIGRAGAADIGGAGRVLKIEENYGNEVVGWPQQNRALPAHHLVGRVLGVEVERPTIIAAAHKHQFAQQDCDIHQHGKYDLGTLSRAVQPHVDRHEGGVVDGRPLRT